jgi:hypothetical protein
MTGSTRRLDGSTGRPERVERRRVRRMRPTALLIAYGAAELGGCDGTANAPPPAIAHVAAELGGLPTDARAKSAPVKDDIPDALYALNDLNQAWGFATAYSSAEARPFRGLAAGG